MSTRHTAILGNLQHLPPRLRFWQRSLGFGEVVVLLAGWTLAAFALDWAFELPLVARAVLLAGGLAALVRILLRARQRLRRQYAMGELAYAVEGSEPELDGHLLNVLEIPQELRRLQADGRSPLEQKLLERALDESCDEAMSANLSGKLDLAPVFQRCGLAAALVVVVVVAAALAPAAFGLWARRGLLLSSEAWPRATHFLFDRAEPVWHVPRKDALEIGGWVTGAAPRQVMLRLESAQSRRDVALSPGAAGTVPQNVLDAAPELKSAPDAQAVAEEGKRLVYTIPSVSEDLKLSFTGGDNTSRTIEVQAHDRPRVLATRWTLRFPDYLARPAQTVENPGADVPVPLGTIVELEAEADQDLESAWFRHGAGERKLADVKGRVASAKFEPRENGFIDLGVVGAAWSLESDPPLRVAFVVLPDRSPSITLAIEGEGRKVTPQGRVRSRIVAEDDHGLAGLSLKTWLRPPGELKPDEELQPQVTAFETTTEKIEAGVRQSADGETLVSALGLPPGGELTLQAAVMDNDAVTGPKLAESQKETFQVVDPEVFRQEMERVRLEAQAAIESLARREDELAMSIAQELADAGARQEPPEASPARAPAGKARAAKGSKSARNARPAAAQPQENEDAGEGAESEENAETPAGEPAEEARPAAAKKAKNAKNAKSSGKPARSASSQTPPAPDGGEAPENGEAQEEPEAEASPATPSPGAKSSPRPGAARKSSARSPAKKTASASPTPETTPGQEAEDAAPPPESDPASEPEAGAEEPGAEPDSPERRAQAIAAEQKRIAAEARAVSERVQAMTESLRDNDLLSPAEERRMQDEVEQPLDELAENRLPQSAEEIQALPRADDPRQEAERAQRQAERMSDELRQVAQKLAGAGDFREILQRMEMIIDLQKQSIGETEKLSPADVKPPAPRSPPPAAPPEPAGPAGEKAAPGAPEPGAQKERSL